MSKTLKTTIPLSLCFAYSAPYIITSWLMAPVGIIQGIYAKYYGLSLTSIATVVLISRIFDAVSDPVIGHYSDRYQARFGTRKPFMLAGGMLFIISSYFLYVPTTLGGLTGPSVNDLEPYNSINVDYFTCWLIAFYLAWTLFEVPHITWGGELSAASIDKTKIYSARTVAGYAGLLLFYSIPLLPYFRTRDITPETLRVSVIIANCLMLIFLYYCVKTVPDRLSQLVSIENKSDPNNTSHTRKKTINKHEKTKRLEYHWLINNKPFLFFILAFLFTHISFGMWFGLIFIYVDAYLNMGEQFAQMILLAFLVGIITAPIWYKLAVWIGKKNVWVLALVFVVISFVYTGMLTPNKARFLDLVAAKTIQSLGLSCIMIIGPSMLSEIIDYSSWKFRANNAATYFSIYTFTYKTSSAIAAALGLGIAGWYGFDASATIHSPKSIFGLTLAIAWLPPVFACIGLMFALLSPIDTRRHAIIRRRLDAQIACDGNVIS